MKLLVTGGGGFVMAHVVRAWLDRFPDAEAVVFDAIPLDPMVKAYLSAHSSRLTYIRADVTDQADWNALPTDVDHIVHGAAVTPHSTLDSKGEWHHPEIENPALVTRVNIGGTVAALEFARRLARLQCFINVSSGSVYASSIPGGRHPPLGEGEWIAPEALYDISKHSAEQICGRYSTLFGMPVHTVRFSTVFGPLDRATPFRAVQCIPNKLATAALSGTPISIRSMDAMGDFISATDVAEALVLMLSAQRGGLKHDVYNIAAGYPTTIGDLAGIVRKAVGGLSVIEDPETRADIEQPAEMSTGRYGAYDISRAWRDFGWQPKPLATGIEDYVAWLRNR